MVRLTRFLGLLVVAVAIAFFFLPIPAVIPSHLQFNTTQNHLVTVELKLEQFPEFNFNVGVNGFPLVIQPKSEASLEFLVNWIRTNKAWVDDALFKYGAILLRGFPVHNPNDFEAVAVELYDDLEDVYLGTSPRTAIKGTKYIHTASEFPPWRIIPAHIEMSFLHNPPKRILFYTQKPNPPPGGETPIVDFQKVWDELKPDVKERFSTKKIRYIRQYYDKDKSNFDFFRTKAWQDMFTTYNRTLVEEKCAEQHFTPIWNDDNSLTLIHDMPPTRTHPISKKEVWSNHLNVLYADNTAAEFAFSAQHLNSWVMTGYYYFFNIYVKIQELLYGHDKLGHQTIHADGDFFSPDDVNHIRQTIWKNTVIYPHHYGDVEFIDNERVAHSRQPFFAGKEDREILVAWG